MAGYAHKIRQSAAPKFIIGGAVTFAIEYGVFYILYFFQHWNLLVANSLSFGCGLVVSFIFNRLWAFKRTEYKRATHHQAALYAVLAFTNLVMNNLIVGSLKYLGLDVRLAKILAILAIAAWNFSVYKYVIFKEE
jgi:putative flippase GtrA